MEHLIPRIREIADRIALTEKKRRKLSDFLKTISPEVEMVRKNTPISQDGLKVVGVDGGCVKKSLHGFDCILVRAAGACFTYNQGKVGKVDYFPSRVPTPRAEVMDAMSDLDWTYFTSIMRQSTEMEAALKSLENFKPDIILLDGSIMPHYSDRPSRNSLIYGRYEDMVKLYKELYSKTKETETLLAGVVEDSRGVSFCRIVKKRILSQIKHRLVPELETILDRTRDTNLLFWVLERGDRTMLFPYSESPQDHPIMRDFQDFSENIKSFYLKTAQKDRPMRVDILGGDKEADRVSSILLSISGHHSEYGLPAPIIEADNVARLSEDEMENFYSRIVSFTGNIPSTMRLRRDQRPF